MWKCPRCLCIPNSSYKSQLWFLTAICVGLTVNTVYWLTHKILVCWLHSKHCMLSTKVSWSLSGLCFQSNLISPPSFTGFHGCFIDTYNLAWCPECLFLIFELGHFDLPNQLCDCIPGVGAYERCDHVNLVSAVLSWHVPYSITF